MNNTEELIAKSYQDNAFLYKSLKHIEKLTDDQIRQCINPDNINESVWGSTILHKACKECSCVLIDILLEKGADINAENMMHLSPLKVAYKYKRLNVVKMLIDNNAVIDHEWFRNELFMHGLDRNINMLKVFLENGLDLNIKNNQGDTPLMSVIYTLWILTNKQIKFAKLLIKHGVDINTQNNDGYTALMIACDMNAIHIVKLLLKHNADKELKNKDGDTALTLMQNITVNNYYTQDCKDAIIALLRD